MSMPHLRTLTCLLLLTAADAAASAPFRHPGILQSRDDLEFMKRKVAASEQPWKQAWDNLLVQPYSSLDFDPTPVTYIVRGAYGQGGVGDRALMQSANAAYSQALQWYITGERVHARKAIEILNAWSGTLWNLEGNDAKLLVGMTGGTFCNAAEILRATDSGWSDADVRQFRKLLLAVYVPLMRDFFPEANGNWDATMINSLLSIGIFCDDHALFDLAVDHFQRGPGNGGITKYIYPSGQCQENTRDQGHVQLGLGHFALAARTAWTQGIDLYSAAGNRLALGFEFTARYMLGEDVPMYGEISAQLRGSFADIYESVFQHYRFHEGLEMPYVTRAVEKTRLKGWTALTMYRGPESAAPRASHGVETPVVLVGALESPTAKAPSDSAKVAVGESIQAALDAKAATGGGWVVLAAGLHVLHQPLHLTNGVTLAGEGRKTILMLDPAGKGPAIVNAAPDLHDVVLRDFVLEGAVSPKPNSDPNGDRRIRAYQNAPSRAGIILSGLHEGQMRNIRFEHLTVRHCTHNGVAIRGAATIAVVASDFSDNGSSVVPGPGLEHNLLIAHSSGIEITGGRFDDSPFGCGISISESSDIAIAGNEAARNHREGVRIEGSSAAHVNGNLAEGNDREGIRFVSSSAVAVSGNREQNNQ
jgi:parallel beta-helix repeat protein